ncbi:MAG: IrrE N-terminal-like domain [Acidimicrobiaceae bacterium]|nr:IrrE N-terminal-like domain [Acidimicrobiaceae bacterium]
MHALRMALTWDPWAALGARPHLVYGRADLPALLGGAVYWPLGRYVAVLIDRRERRVRRRCLLAHELVHDERLGGCDADFMPDSWDAVVSREEGWVNDIVADRLVPPAELQALCLRLADLEIGVTPADVAAEFDVTEEVAARALSRLPTSFAPAGCTGDGP